VPLPAVPQVNRAVALPAHCLLGTVRQRRRGHAPKSHRCSVCAMPVSARQVCPVVAPGDTVGWCHGLHALGASHRMPHTMQMREADGAAVFNCGHVYHASCLSVDEQSPSAHCLRCMSAGRSVARAPSSRTPAAPAAAPSAAAAVAAAAAGPPAPAARATQPGAKERGGPALTRDQLRSFARLRAALLASSPAAAVGALPLCARWPGWCPLSHSAPSTVTWPRRVQGRRRRNHADGDSDDDEAAEDTADGRRASRPRTNPGNAAEDDAEATSDDDPDDEFVGRDRGRYVAMRAALVARRASNSPPHPSRAVAPRQVAPCAAAAVQALPLGAPEAGQPAEPAQLFHDARAEGRRRRGRRRRRRLAACMPIVQRRSLYVQHMYRRGSIRVRPPPSRRRRAHAPGSRGGGGASSATSRASGPGRRACAAASAAAAAGPP